MAVTAKGIDVSKWQGNVDMKKVKAAGYTFVILNAGFGKYISQKDPFFEQNYKNAKSAGLGVGVYWYSYAKTVSDAAQEAAVCLQAISGKQFEYPIFYDFEDSTQASLSSSVVSSIINKFCSTVENKGYYVGVYSMVSWLGTKIPSSVCKKYDVWCAHFGVSKPAYSGAYGIWQYTSTGKVNGVTGNCDCNYAYKDYPSAIKNAGLNGFKKPSVLKTLDTSGFKLGDKGNGVFAYKCLLKLAGKKGIISVSIDDTGGFGGGTEKATNELLKKLGYKPIGIAGQKLIYKLYKLIKG